MSRRAQPKSGSHASSIFPYETEQIQNLRFRVPADYARLERIIDVCILPCISPGWNVKPIHKPGDSV